MTAAKPPPVTQREETEWQRVLRLVSETANRHGIPESVLWARLPERYSKQRIANQVCDELLAELRAMPQAH